MLAKVQGGTNARCKQPRQEPRADWTCSNGHHCRGYHVRCLTAGCNERRMER